MDNNKEYAIKSIITAARLHTWSVWSAGWAVDQLEHDWLESFLTYTVTNLTETES